MEALKRLKLAFFCLRKHECDDAIALLKALPSLAARSEKVTSDLLKQVTDVLCDVNAQMHAVDRTQFHMSCAVQLANNRAMILAMQLAEEGAVRLAQEEHARGRRAVMGLDMTIMAVGRTKWCFEDVRRFWVILCYEIAGPNKTSEASFMAVAQKGTGLLVDAMTKEWYRWLALTKTNYTAMCSMNDVKTTVHRILSTLPNSAPASERLDKLFKDLMSKFKENDALKAQIEVQEKATVAL